jgi:SSS family solute:Na+ symporter
VIGSGIAAAAAGWTLAHSRGSALSLYYTVTGIVAGGLAGLFLLAFLCPRAGRAAAQAGVIACLAVTTWATLTADGGKIADWGRWNFPWHEYMIGAVGHVVLLATGLLFSVLIPSVLPADRGLTLWGWLEQKPAEPISVTRVC